MRANKKKFVRDLILDKSLIMRESGSITVGVTMLAYTRTTVRCQSFNIKSLILDKLANEKFKESFAQE